MANNDRAYSIIARLPMKMNKKTDPLVAEIEKRLRPGSFCPRDQVFELTADLDKMSDRLAGLAKGGEADRAMRLYETLLAGIYAKIEECDDECYLAMTFADAFCGWIKARQAAGCPAEETIRQILNWKKNDDYGFCHRIEKEVVKALDKPGRQLFIAHFCKLVEQAMAGLPATSAKAIFEYDNEVRLPAIVLKEIYEARKDAPGYTALCDKLGFSPLDCERLAEMEMSRQHWAKALEWVERGMGIARERDWHNEASHSLERIRPEILRKLGRKQDALASAWAGFQQDPNDLSYEELMRYVPQREKSAWRERALAEADKADLGSCISLCVKAGEWNRLAGRIQSAKPAELESLSHYCTEPAAKGLAKKAPLAAAKLYRALGLRIVNAGKSKYYGAALNHFKQARDLYGGAGRAAEWEELVQIVRTTHARKSGFLSAFNQIVSGMVRLAPSFADRAQQQWSKLAS
jgi:tetratricopeptide (TPR) repeat protein